MLRFLASSLLLLLCSISRVSTQNIATTTTNAIGLSTASTTTSAYPTQTFNYLQDRFPDKVYVDPQGSLGFNVEYYNWYKVVTDTKTGATYALVCCNMPFNQPGFTGVFHVPVQYIAAMDVKSIAFIELLESWQLIRAVGSPNNVTSNCVYNNLRAAENLQPFNLSLPNATSPLDIVFSQTPYNDSKVVLVNITDDYAPLEKAKWIYFYSTFLNQEGLAMNVYQNIQNQYNCHKSNFAHVGQKLLAWVNYDPAASTWHINTDKYHNTLLSDAGGNALVPWGGSAFTNSSLFRSAMNKVQLVVDSTPFTAQQNTFSQWETISGYLPNLDPFNETFLVQKRVWRTDGLVNYNGYDDWSERSAARPDLALQDIIAIQYPTYQPNYRVTWLRDFARGDNPQYIENLLTNCTSASSLFTTTCTLSPYSDSSTTFSTSDSSPPSGNATASSVNGGGGGLSPGAIAGTVIGASIGALGIVLVGYVVLRRRRNNPDNPWLTLNDI